MKDVKEISEGIIEYKGVVYYNRLPEPVAPVNLRDDEIQKLCDVIESSLNSAKLLNGEQLLDFISHPEDNTIKTGKEEIANLVEHVYFDLSEYLSTPSAKPSDEDIEKWAKKEFPYSDREWQFTTGQVIGAIEGAKAMRDNLITPKNE